MAYVKTTWVEGGAPGISADKLNNIESGIEDNETAIGQNEIAIEDNETAIGQSNLFNVLLTPGKYKITEFDEPTSGDITETIKLTSDDSTYATLITEFDEPTSGDITTTLLCTDLSIHNKIVVEFDEPTSGDITETSTEVV